MEKLKNFKWEALIIAIGLILGGDCIGSGLEAFHSDDRTVNVKGLAEMEVPADKVTWPLVYKCIGNDIQSIYNDISRTNGDLIGYLKQKGIKDEEISIGAPNIVDLDAERYMSTKPDYRYNVTSVITVTSSNVELIRSLIGSQSELLKKGIVLTGDYNYSIRYEFTGLNEIKPKMIEEATRNARTSAEKFAKDSGSRLGKIKHAHQGQFSISDRDFNTPHIKKVRVVTTIDYLLD